MILTKIDETGMIVIVLFLKTLVVIGIFAYETQSMIDVSGSNNILSLLEILVSV